jgi:hypothetical protein
MTLTERDHITALFHVPSNNIIELTTQQDIDDPDVWTGSVRIWPDSPVFDEFTALEGSGLTLKPSP